MKFYCYITIKSGVSSEQGGENHMKNAIVKDVKLTSDALESITERLQELVMTNSDVPVLAYAGGAGPVARCSCEKGCEGCTSW
jgi:hypothetical protein